MVTLLAFLTLLAAVSARNIPNADYVPTKEQLAMIFGADSIFAKMTAVETPASVPNESINIEKYIKPHQKGNAEIFNTVTETAELKIRIKDDDTEKKGANKTGKENSEVPVIRTRLVTDDSLTDDRVAIGGDDCPTGQVRFNQKCVTPD